MDPAEIRVLNMKEGAQALLKMRHKNVVFSSHSEKINKKLEFYLEVIKFVICFQSECNLHNCKLHFK